jgi:hypothetical protein
MDELLDALAAIRLAANLIDESQWPQDMFLAAEKADYILVRERGAEWWKPDPSSGQSE